MICVIGIIGTAGLAVLDGGCEVLGPWPMRKGATIELKLQMWFGVGESQQRSLPSQEAAAQTAEEDTQGEELAGPINPPLRFQLRVDSGHEYGIGRGVSKETLEYFGAGFCLSKGTFAGRFVFPLHNEAGELVGYAGRATDDSEPKYLFPPGAKGFHKSHLVYNLHRILSESPETDLVIVVEGFFGCFRLKQGGIRIVALLGSSLSVEQEELLCHHFRRAFLLFDGDEAGRGATDTCLQRLGRRLWVKAISLPDHVQPDHLDEDAIKQLLGPAL
jgi:DNA primase-like protein/Toprim domain-containing protein